MKRNNTISKFIALVLLLTVVTLILVSGTYSKYTSQVTANDTATVANWKIKVNDNDITVASPTTTFNLFSTIKDTADGNTETDVATVSGKKLIAPGTQGSFDLVVKNESQVTAEYTIAFVETKSDDTLPIEYSLTGTSGWETDLNELAIASTPQKVAMGATETTTVYWRWAFTGAVSANYTSSQTDTTDTKLGVDAQTAANAATVNVQATVTVNQVN